MKEYFEICVKENILTQRKDNYKQNVIEHFSFFSLFMDVNEEENECLYIIPKPNQ